MNSFSSVGFEIGGCFLLAVLLMYGTMGGFGARYMRFGGGAAILLGVGLLAFVIYYFGPELYYRLTDSFAPDEPSASHSPASPTPVPPAEKPSTGHRPSAVHAKTNVTSRPKSRTPIINNGGPPEPEVVPPTTLAPESARAEPAPEAPAAAEPPAQTVAAPPAGPANPPSAAAESSGPSQFDSKTVRAIKSIGHILHIGRKKPAANASPGQPEAGSK